MTDEDKFPVNSVTGELLHTISYTLDNVYVYEDGESVYVSDSKPYKSRSMTDAEHTKLCIEWDKLQSEIEEGTLKLKLAYSDNKIFTKELILSQPHMVCSLDWVVLVDDEGLRYPMPRKDFWNMCKEAKLENGRVKSIWQYTGNRMRNRHYGIEYIRRIK